MFEILGIIFAVLITAFACLIIAVWFSLPKKISLSLVGKHVFITGVF